MLNENKVSEDNREKLPRVRGLDSLRFIAALWVMFYHVGTAPIHNHFERETVLLKILGASLDCIFNGPAAVIVFFVISGFCINYPQSKGGEIDLASFLSRRYIRILIPLFVCLAVTRMLCLSTDTVGNLVGWSIECEIIYYTIYPLLYKFSRKVGWLGMVALTLPLSLAYVGLTRPAAMMYPSFGLWGNAILGLPCWLLGCKLAETPIQDTGFKTVLLHRLAIFFGGMLTFSLMLHAKIGFPWTLNIFAIGIYFWLGREIGYYLQFAPSVAMESAGCWSYSLYLVHGPMAEWLGKFPPWHDPSVLLWLVQVCLVLLVSYLFYLLIEKPSHWLARMVGNRLSYA